MLAFMHIKISVLLGGVQSRLIGLRKKRKAILFFHYHRNNFNQRSMGSQETKDPNIDVFMQLNKPFYFAGETVTGIVFINCRVHVGYPSLSISLEGMEQCFWIQSRGKYAVPYSDQRKTYFCEFGLKKFNGKLMQGQYAFPFKMLLPAAMPASLEAGYHNFIRYTLTAFLPPYENNSRQFYSRPLFLREPDRRDLPPVISEQQSDQPQCCCCKSYGTVKMTISAPKQAMNGEQINISGVIDNSLGLAPLKQVRIQLVNKQIRVSATAKIWTHIQSCDVLWRSEREFQKGQKEEYHVSVAIPSPLRTYTAIGNIIESFFYFQVIGQIGCCADDPCALVYVVMNTSFPPEQPLDPPAPANWNPRTDEPVSLMDLPPYIYRPVPNIVAINQRGNAVDFMDEMKRDLPSTEQIYRIE